MTTHTTQAHRHSCKTEINLIILLVNINGIKSKLEELKLLIHTTHAYIITIHETKLTPKAKLPKYITSPLCAPKVSGGGLITLIRDNITFTTTYINTHNTELQMVNLHINNTKHTTIANMYTSSRQHIHALQNS